MTTLPPAPRRSLHAQLVKYVAEGGTAHETQIVEILRSVSELMVYGDKHSERFFECAARAEPPPRASSRAAAARAARAAAHTRRPQILL